MVSKLFFAFMLIFTVNAHAIVADPVWDAVSNAFKQGDTRTIATYFSNVVEFSIQEKDNTYNKSQALSALDAFLSVNKPRAFNQVHQGTSKGKESYYCIGELETSNGKFRVYVYFKITNNATNIQEIRIDKI